MTHDEIESVRVPLPDFVRQVAHEAALEAAKAVIADHLRTCPVAASLRLTRARVIAFIVGASAVGGGVGAAFVRFLAIL